MPPDALILAQNAPALPQTPKLDLRGPTSKGSRMGGGIAPNFVSRFGGIEAPGSNCLHVGMGPRNFPRNFGDAEAPLPWDGVLLTPRNIKHTTPLYVLLYTYVVSVG